MLRPLRTALALATLAMAPALASAQQTQPAPLQTARAITYHPRDLVPVRSRLLFTTLIVLPDGEQVIEATCGDKDHWIVNVRDGLVSVKPTKAGASTNLNLVATPGQVYAFLLNETTDPNTKRSIETQSPSDITDLDLTIYLERDEPSPGYSASTPPRFIPAERLDDYRAQADLARDQARQAVDRARAELETGVNAFRESYPVSMRFPYRIDQRKTSFRIKAMWHDGTHTYIQTSATELPALYEYQDNMPALVNFDVRNGTYIVPKVLRDGYLQLGTARLGFRLVEEQ